MEKSSNRRFGVRTVAAIVAGLMVGGMCTAMTASAAAIVQPGTVPRLP